MSYVKMGSSSVTDAWVFTVRGELPYPESRVIGGLW
jgi:hypothetical protein